LTVKRLHGAQKMAHSYRDKHSTLSNNNIKCSITDEKLEPRNKT